MDCPAFLPYISSVRVPWKQSLPKQCTRGLSWTLNPPHGRPGPLLSRVRSRPGPVGWGSCRTCTIRPVWDPGHRPREQVPGVPREQRRRGRRPNSAPPPQADQPGPCGGARQGRKTREEARRPRSPTGPPLAPAGRPPKAPTVTAVAGPGAGLREGRGPTPDSGAPAPGGGTQSLWGGTQGLGGGAR